MVLLSMCVAAILLTLVDVAVKQATSSSLDVSHPFASSMPGATTVVGGRHGIDGGLADRGIGAW